MCKFDNRAAVGFGVARMAVSAAHMFENLTARNRRTYSAAHHPDNFEFDCEITARPPPPRYKKLENFSFGIPAFRAGYRGRNMDGERSHSQDPSVRKPQAAVCR